jgi:hypothetical protein
MENILKQPRPSMHAPINKSLLNPALQENQAMSLHISLLRELTMFWVVRLASASK